MSTSSDDRLLHAATSNAAAFWTALGTARRHEVSSNDAYLAVMSDTRIGNRILMLSAAPTDDDVADVRDLVRTKAGTATTVEDPFSTINIPSTGLSSRPMPVMARAPRKVTASGAWQVTRVTTIDGLREAEHVIVHGFPLARVQPYEAGEALPDALLDYPGFEVFLIGREGMSVGACVTMVAATCVGVYWVTTLPEHRSQGVARSLMVGILEHHAERTMTLDASVAGKPLYDSLGFEVVATSTWWT